MKKKYPRLPVVISYIAGAFFAGLILAFWGAHERHEGFREGVDASICSIMIERGGVAQIDASPSCVSLGHDNAADMANRLDRLRNNT